MIKPLIQSDTPNPVGLIGIDRGHIHALNVQFEQGVPVEDTLARAEELHHMRHAMGEVSQDIATRAVDAADPFLTFVHAQHNAPTAQALSNNNK